MLGTLVTLFAGLVIGTVGFELIHDAAPGVTGNRWVAYVLSLLLSTGAVFIFLVSSYYLLTNEKLSIRDVLPGAILASILLQVSFQILPLYVALSQRDEALTLRALGAPVILLIWLYLMANAIVFGASLSGITGGSTVTVAAASYSAGNVSERISEAATPTVIGTMNHQRRRRTTP